MELYLTPWYYHGIKVQLLGIRILPIYFLPGCGQSGPMDWIVVGNGGMGGMPARLVGVGLAAIRVMVQYLSRVSIPSWDCCNGSVLCP